MTEGTGDSGASARYNVGVLAQVCRRVSVMSVSAH